MPERPAPRELQRMYRRLGSIPAVAAELGVAYETARRWLQGADVQFRSKGRPSQTAAQLDIPALVRRVSAAHRLQF